jgi:hypothetical protein
VTSVIIQPQRAKSAALQARRCRFCYHRGLAGLQVTGAAVYTGRMHSITSSAMASSPGGKLRPSALAVLRELKLGRLHDRQVSDCAVCSRNAIIGGPGSLLRVKSTHYRSATLRSASPRLADITDSRVLPVLMVAERLSLYAPATLACSKGSGCKGRDGPLQ